MHSHAAVCLNWVLPTAHRSLRPVFDNNPITVSICPLPESSRVRGRWRAMDHQQSTAAEHARAITISLLSHQSSHHHCLCDMITASSSHSIYLLNVDHCPSLHVFHCFSQCFPFDCQLGYIGCPSEFWCHKINSSMMMVLIVEKPDGRQPNDDK